MTKVAVARHHVIDDFTAALPLLHQVIHPAARGSLIAFESRNAVDRGISGSAAYSVSWRTAALASHLNGITSVVARFDPEITSASISITMPGNSLIAPPPGCIIPWRFSVHFPHAGIQIARMAVADNPLPSMRKVSGAPYASPAQHPVAVDKLSAQRVARFFNEATAFARSSYSSARPRTLRGQPVRY